MIVFSTIINGFKEFSSLTDSQSGGLIAMTFSVLFFIGISIYSLICSFKDYKIFKSVAPSLIIVLVGFFIFDTASEINNTINVICELGGIVLLCIPATIYFNIKFRKNKK
jgi:ABC-type polysaccharide transport system permease subunit